MSRALVVAALLAIVTLPGCLFFNPCREKQFTSATWTEPGLFSAFPAEGRHGAYTVGFQHQRGYLPKNMTRGQAWSTPSSFDAGNVTRKSAQSSPLDTGLTVERDDTARWERWSASSHGDAATRASLESTFSDLGLPPPEHAPSTFRWSSTGC
jgi:hypothetical protein